MASEMPPAAEQQETLPAQHNKQLMWRLAAWGGAAAFSLAAAVIVSQTGFGHKRLQIAFSGEEQPYETRPATATATVPMPPADLIAVKRATLAVKRATDQTAAKLAVVARNTEEARAETKRLALQVSKLSADSFHVTGRLANIENQIGSITGSIKKQAEEAAAAAVAKAMPANQAFGNAFDVTAPIISPPATTYPKLSLIVPPAPDSKAATAKADAAKPADDKTAGDKRADKTRPDVATTSSITRPDGKPKDQSRVAAKAGSAAAPEPKPMAKTEELKAGVAAEMKAAPKVRPDMAAKPSDKPMAKPMAKAKAEPEPKTDSAPPADATTKTASVAEPPRRRVSRHWVPTRGYGIDLGGAESVDIAKAQWAAVKANFGPVLGGMRPLVVRNHRLLTRGDYRLVAGRTYSLEIAQRICERLALQQVTCQPVEFDDGRMVWR